VPAQPADLTAALTAFYVLVLVLVWAALGIICWVFWRAKKRDDEKRKELEWRNEPSS
jgi:hypothetical protein